MYNVRVFVTIWTINWSWKWKAHTRNITQHSTMQWAWNRETRGGCMAVCHLLTLLFYTVSIRCDWKQPTQLTLIHYCLLGYAHTRLVVTADRDGKEGFAWNFTQCRDLIPQCNLFLVSPNQTLHYLFLSCQQWVINIFSLSSMTEILN